MTEQKTGKKQQRKRKMKVAQNKMSKELCEIPKKAPIGVGPNVQMTI